MIGPFCPEQGTSSHETVMDLASTNNIMTVLTDMVGATDMEENNNIDC